MTFKSVHIAILAGMVWGAPALGRTDPAFETILAGWDNDTHPDLRGVVILREGRSSANAITTVKRPTPFTISAPPERV